LRIGKENSPRKIILFIFLAIISLAVIFPVIYMFANSFLNYVEAEVTYKPLFSGMGSGGKLSFKLIPDKVDIIQYYTIFLKNPLYLMMFWNSVIITLPIMIGQMIVASLAAFAFSKLRFPFRNTIFFIYIIVMMMPFQVTLVPNYITLDALNLLGTFQAIILPGVFSTFGVFLLKQFMTYLPDAYCEAGKIDGAGYLRIFSRIILPQCKGALASLAILVFIDNWNMVEQPLIFLENEMMHPLSIFLGSINQQEISIAFACGFLYMIPTILIFLYFENDFIEGIKLSGIK
jgi:multiple sugar transport system permease protein